MIVLIPAFEPADHLPVLVSALAAADPTLRIVVIDDGSGPAYAKVFARAVLAGAQLLRHKHNRGKGAALKTGFAHIRSTHPGAGVVTADADGQHTPADILAVAERVSAAGERASTTLVLGCRSFDGGSAGSGIGTRAGSGAGSGAAAGAGAAAAAGPRSGSGSGPVPGPVPLRSRFGNEVSRRLFRIAAGWRLSDTQTGLRGIPAVMLPWLLDVPGERFEYEQRMLLGLRGAGFTAAEVPIETVYLAGNASSHFRPVLDSLRVMLPTLVFAASSLLGFAVDTVALFILQAATGALVPSIIAARVLSASVNFLVNRRVVFLQRGRARLGRQLAAYAVLAGVLLASNIVWMSYLTGIGVPLWLAKLVTEIVLFCTSFRAQRSVVFADAAGSGAYRDRGIARTAGVDSSPQTTLRATKT